MKNKVCLVFGILLLTAGSVWAQKPKDIPVIITPSDSLDRPKSIVLCPTVTLDGAELTFDFPSTTPLQVIIMDENNNCQVVYSESFASTTQVIVDLEDEGIGEGSYRLWLYAFCEWWEGEFIVEEE